MTFEEEGGFRAFSSGLLGLMVLALWHHGTLQQKHEAEDDVFIAIRKERRVREQRRGHLGLKYRLR